jgi:hypothetical protein
MPVPVFMTQTMRANKIFCKQNKKTRLTKMSFVKAHLYFSASSYAEIAG